MSSEFCLLVKLGVGGAKRRIHTLWLRNVWLETLHLLYLYNRSCNGWSREWSFPSNVTCARRWYRHWDWWRSSWCRRLRTSGMLQRLKHEKYWLSWLRDHFRLLSCFEPYYESEATCKAFHKLCTKSRFQNEVQSNTEMASDCVIAFLVVKWFSTLCCANKNTALTNHNEQTTQGTNQNCKSGKTRFTLYWLRWSHKA